MNQKPNLNYASQFAILLALLGLALIVSSFIMGLFATLVLNTPLSQAGTALLEPQNANLGRLLNTITTFIAFFLPAWAVARIIHKNPFSQLGFNRVISPKQVSLVVLITLGALFLGGALGTLNELIPMPAGFLKKARALEEAYKTTMLAMATMHSFTDYVLSLVVIALAPAIFEEVLFRGSMQTIFIGWTRNPWTGIIITSILFSAIHGSYFGFLPRFGLGIILGLVYSISKNIWLNITMHFLNNAIVVSQIYLLTRMGKPVKEAMDESMPVWLGVIALVLLYYVFTLFRKESEHLLFNKQPITGNE
jgi:membrane protease YdiL (CAAX protease family)